MEAQLKQKQLNQILRHDWLNGWRLFSVVSFIISAMIIVAGFGQDMSSGEGVSEMIGYSVRWAVPFIYLVIAASALKKLFPGHALVGWLMRNRKYLGLCFAVAMAWQGLFIFVISVVHRPYYLEEIFYFRDELEGTFGYVLLAALVVTSFQLGRKQISSDQWRVVHLVGVYYLWAYPFSTYWWNVFYYPTVEPYGAARVIDFLFYAAGFTVMVLRIAASGKLRLAAAAKVNPGARPSFGLRAGGACLVLVGCVAAVTGRIWYTPLATGMEGITISVQASEWLPFWPLEPFYALMAIWAGVMLMTHVSPPEAATAKSALAS